MSGVVNVGGGESRGGECRTIPVTGPGNANFETAASPDSKYKYYNLHLHQNIIERERGRFVCFLLVLFFGVIDLVVGNSICLMEGEKQSFV